MISEQLSANDDFKRLKVVCVPLLGASRLTPATRATTSSLLAQLNIILSEIPPENLTTNLISYVFLPLSTILQRNASVDIPNQILEKLLIALKFLAESWWWTCDIKVWEQIFMLCGAVVSGLDMKPENKDQKRDDETKVAATQCILALLRPRKDEEAAKRDLLPNVPEERLETFQEHAQSSKFIPIIGQTLDSVMVSAASSNISLQRASLETTYLLIDLYLPDNLIPSVLPGTVSAMTKICLGISNGKKGWANGEIVALGLQVMQAVVTKAISDDVCVRDGAIRRVHDLSDLLNTAPAQIPASSNQTTYGTQRTESWLRGTSTQLHIAINTLSSLLSHPTPAALHGLLNFSASIIQSTSLTLPQTQPLLLSFLLSLSVSDYTSVSSEARQRLTFLLTNPSGAQIPLQHAIMANLGDNLSALPRLLSTQVDSRISHAAGLITAVCRLACDTDSNVALPVIAKGIGKLLGPTGGIEKWGWSLLFVLEIVEPPIVVTTMSGAQLALENDPSSPHWINFPELLFKNISSRDTRATLNNMFHALGAAGGDSVLFTVEWFINVGHTGTSTTSVAALWCACRLLEGIAHIALYEGQTFSLSTGIASRLLDKQARSLAKNIAEIWDMSYDTANETPLPNTEDNSVLVQHQTGINPLHETLKIIKPSGPQASKTKYQPVVHRALSLQLIAVAAGISQARFPPLFIHVLYPVLHSLVSPISFLSSTALATLNYITIATSYASPANLLLSNFDYVLDSVSRRLTQRWLDIDATKVLGIMIRLVGADVVEKAGDVVEECFDRLDEYHGYGLIVDGLIEVLMEVIKVVEIEVRASKNTTSTSSEAPTENRGSHRVSLDTFFEFLPKRFESPPEDNTDYGPAPREPWAAKDSDDEDQEEGNEDQDGSGFSKPQSASSNERPPTGVQSLTKQIVSRSLYFLTHDSAIIRARILKLLALSVPVLPESALLPSIHSAWPFILNRLGDSETFVVSAAAGLVEALSKDMGEFMFRRVWDDVWPKFQSMLSSLEKGEPASALTRSDKRGVGTESAYTHSHRLYRSFIKTMTFALKGVHEHETSFWEVIMAFRRFLSVTAQEELQHCAVALYVQAGKINPDSVWLTLSSTIEPTEPVMEFMKGQWDIRQNANIVLKSLD